VSANIIFKLDFTLLSSNWTLPYGINVGVDGVLGTYRYFLALFVAVHHMELETVFWLGPYAVFGFYVISGFLMTLVLNEVYTGTENVWRYLANRCLRIFPLYWGVFAITILCLLVGIKIKYAVIPTEPSAMLNNLSFIFGDWSSRLTVTQSWSLRVELVFYILMVALVRDFKIVIIWFLFSILVVVYLIAHDATFDTFYTGLLSSSLAFSLGSLVYFLNGRYKLKSYHLIISVIGFCFHLVFAQYIWAFPNAESALASLYYTESFGLYGNIFWGGYIMYAIASSSFFGRPKNRLSKIDRFLGDMAYGIFLSHWIAIGIVKYVLGAIGNEISLIIFTVFTIILMHFITFVLFNLVENPINKRFRDKIRPQVRNLSEI